MIQKSRDHQVILLLWCHEIFDDVTQTHKSNLGILFGNFDVYVRDFFINSF